ncbi:hypothetical protein AVEN_253727-1 [Araneus ventricosus]|uniref:Uncharacterized protein n=1 Tax=Araneus ventricosus TaxID=182803 RepID=A0A4Y2DX45_ARAVE|nr:hypothetical protein AVEN_253727-1 [Araneus ventricosus]
MRKAPCVHPGLSPGLKITKAPRFFNFSSLSGLHSEVTEATALRSYDAVGSQSFLRAGIYRSSVSRDLVQLRSLCSEPSASMLEFLAPRPSVEFWCRNSSAFLGWYSTRF